ncbi:MAG: hypothetical protein JWO72_2455 [Caulobacteraceae bacterium]|nr:hypothetical protein [Caulobacteraceae bacterium]
MVSRAAGMTPAVEDTALRNLTSARLGWAPVVLGIAATSLGPGARAQTLPVVQANREIGVGFSALYRDYRESFPAGTPGRDREGGWTPGVAAGASWMGDAGGLRNLYGSIRVTYNAGNQNYRGSLFGSDTALEFRSGLANTTVTAQLGKGFLVSPRLLITPAATFGYQLWNRDLGPGQTEDYRTFMAGAAVRADYQAARRLVLRGQLGLAETVDPRITFRYQHSYGTALAARPVYQAGAGLDYALTARFHLSADAQVSRYGYGRSRNLATLEKGLIFEPASTTTDSQLQLGLAYAF